MCLVCKEMAVVGTPLLYRNMVVHTDRLNQDLISAISVPGRHLGCAHVRTLRIESKYSSYGQDFDDPEKSVTTAALCRLLVAIPEHVLTRFE